MHCRCRCQPARPLRASPPAPQPSSRRWMRSAHPAARPQAQRARWAPPLAGSSASFLPMCPVCGKRHCLTSLQPAHVATPCLARSYSRVPSPPSPGPSRTSGRAAELTRQAGGCSLTLHRAADQARLWWVVAVAAALYMAARGVAFSPSSLSHAVQCCTGDLCCCARLQVLCTCARSRPAGSRWRGSGPMTRATAATRAISTQDQAVGGGAGTGEAAGGGGIGSSLVCEEVRALWISLLGAEVCFIGSRRSVGPLACCRRRFNVIIT